MDERHEGEGERGWVDECVIALIRTVTRSHQVGRVQVDLEIGADTAGHRSSVALMNEHDRNEEGKTPKRHEYDCGAELPRLPWPGRITIGRR